MACFISDDISGASFSSFPGGRDFFIYEYGVVWFNRPEELFDD